MNARIWVLGTLVGGWALAAGCANTDDVAGRADRDGAAPSFTKEDAAVLPEAGLISYCASDKCSAPYTTCPNSRFPCDINLSNDPANCGSCGFACPRGLALGGEFQCVAGKCELRCSNSGGQTADCDGIPDNGCEVRLGNSDNCNACGDKCPDPNKPCIANTATQTAKCGCDAGLTYCKNSFFQPCVSLPSSDTNCGACGTVCPTESEAGPAPPHAHYGCVESDCGHLKCDSGYADCDGDLQSPGSNGCEVSLVTTTDCGACKAACDSGQTCAVEYLTGQPKCMCGPGERNCGTATAPACKDIDSDPFNCGSCGTWCGLYYLTNGLQLSHNIPTCSAGSCGFECENGWADCNGRIDDGCEVNTNSDPGNCGGCGKTCDAIAGQACLAGQCALEPCDRDAGPTR